MGTIVSVPLANQLQVPFIAVRDIYEIRERPSRMYSWTALVTAQIASELPWNILGSTIFFLCWYWTVAFPTDRGGYTYLMYSVINPIYYTTIGQVSSYSTCGGRIVLIFPFRLWLRCRPTRKLLRCCSASCSHSSSHCASNICRPRPLSD